MIYDTIIIGGGPAGVSAGVYAARKKLKTLFLTDEFGGQSSVSPNIENWIGTIAISGQDLAKNLKEHLENYKGEHLEIVEHSRVAKVEKIDNIFKVTANNNQIYESKTILITTGSSRKKLTVPGATEYEHKGITYCATCDAPMFGDKDVVVIGGGNAGFETASQLLSYAKSVTLLHKNAEFKADKITVNKVLENPKMTAITNAVLSEVTGDKFVTGLIYKDNISGESHTLSAQGIFVEIGHQPTTDFVKDLVETDQYGAIVIDPRNQKTNVVGVWAAGDCTNRLYHQNNIAAGDGTVALEDIYSYLLKN